MSGCHTVDDLRRKYNDAATRYDRLERLCGVLGLSRLRRDIFGHARGRVLEVAVGTGMNLEYYPPGCEITAVDISERMLAIAQDRASRLGLDVAFHLMNAEHLEFPDGSFDTVTSSLSTCTFPDPITVLREMGRVCHPDGRILLLEHGRSSIDMLGKFQDLIAGPFSRPCGCHWNREPQRLVQQAGLRIIQARRMLVGAVHAIEAAPGS